MVTEDEWFPPEQDPRVDTPFWTVTLASIYETYRHLGHPLFHHSTIQWQFMHNVTGFDVRPFFSQLPGVMDMMILCHRYVEEWVRVFYATLYIEHDRERIQFMF